jgi:ABC-type multidrug transport system ATPase subunit
MSDTESTPRTVAAAQHVKHAYGEGSVPVLTDVSLDLPAGELTVVVGPNGSGKSTFLQLLSGVIEPTGGTVRRFGESRSDSGGPEIDSGGDRTDPGGDDRGDRRTVGWLPQRLAPRGSFTARETVEFYAGFVDAGPSPDDALARVGMQGVADRRVDALSGGMRRLLGVALATIGDPPLLVLDEPTSGLDPTMTMRIFDVLSGLAASGRAVICSSHDLAAVERTADTVVLLDRGEIQARGSPTEVASAVDARSLADAFAGTIEVDDTRSETTVRSGVGG